jgi:tetratricopeptide (TPR) repeat protein
LLLNSNTSQESIAQVLTGLKSQIGRVEFALQARNDAEPPSFDIGEDSERISRNLRLFVRAAESFHSSASTIIADGARSTVWGGSVMGDPLSDEQHRNIQDWIPPPIIEKEDRTQQESQPSGQIAQSNDVSLNGREEDSEQDSEADSDIERDMLKRFQDLAITSFSKGDYPKAERFLVKAIDRSARDDPSEDMTKMKLMQAYIYGYQGNWSDSERVLGLAALKGAADPMAFYGLHALALRKLDMGAYNNAIRYCKRALMGRRRIDGKEGA